MTDLRQAAEMLRGRQVHPRTRAIVVPATQRIYALFAKTRTFDLASVHPLLLDVLDRVLGHYQLSAPVGIRIGPGENAQVLHTDDMIYPLPQPHPPVSESTSRRLCCIGSC